MASSAKDIQLRELKDTVSQLKTMISEQTELIQSLRLIIDEKSRHEKALQEQVDYLTKKLFGSSSERRSDNIPGIPLSGGAALTIILQAFWIRLTPFMKGTIRFCLKMAMAPNMILGKPICL